MDFSALSAELQDIARRYNGKDSDANVSTTMYCEMFHKILQKTDHEVTDHGDQIVILWMTLSQLCSTANTLTACLARDQLYQNIFLQCAKAVLNVKWQNLSEDDQSKINFTQTVKATHTQLASSGFHKFRLLLNIMHNPWTNPTIVAMMSGEADDNDEEVKNYISSEDPQILKLRVEMMMKDDCEEFALNLCDCLLNHETFKDDLDLKSTQLKLLFNLNLMERLQECCVKIVCHDAVKLILKLEQKTENRSLCVKLVQIFLVQSWIKPDKSCCTQDLLKLWIRHQFVADQDKEKFLESVWAVTKLSVLTEQILQMVTGLHRECGNDLIQLYTDLCIYAINVDKGCCEQKMLQGDMDGVKTHQKAIAQTCRKLANLYNGISPKIARIGALTAFSLDATLVNLCLVERMFNRKYCTHLKKQTCDICKAAFKSVTKCVQNVTVNPATLYEVERLLNMLRPYYLNPDHCWMELLPVCQKFMKERNTAIPDNMPEVMTPKKEREIKKLTGKEQKNAKKSVKQDARASKFTYYCDDNASYISKESGSMITQQNQTVVLKPTVAAAAGSANQMSACNKGKTRLIPEIGMQPIKTTSKPRKKNPAKVAPNVKLIPWEYSQSAEDTAKFLQMVKSNVVQNPSDPTPRPRMASELIKKKPSFTPTNIQGPQMSQPQLLNTVLSQGHLQTNALLTPGSQPSVTCVMNPVQVVVSQTPAMGVQYKTQQLVSELIRNGHLQNVLTLKDTTQVATATTKADVQTPKTVKNLSGTGNYSISELLEATKAATSPQIIAQHNEAMKRLALQNSGHQQTHGTSSVTCDQTPQQQRDMAAQVLSALSSSPPVIGGKVQNIPQTVIQNPLGHSQGRPPQKTTNIDPARKKTTTRKPKILSSVAPKTVVSHVSTTQVSNLVMANPLLQTQTLISINQGSPQAAIISPVIHQTPVTHVSHPPKSSTLVSIQPQLHASNQPSSINVNQIFPGYTCKKVASYVGPTPTIPKPPVKSTQETPAKISDKRPSADELQGIVNWLQMGFEDDKFKQQKAEHPVVSQGVTTGMQMSTVSIAAQQQPVLSTGLSHAVTVSLEHPAPVLTQPRVPNLVLPVTTTSITPRSSGIVQLRPKVPIHTVETFQRQIAAQGTVSANICAAPVGTEQMSGINNAASLTITTLSVPTGNLNITSMPISTPAVELVSQVSGAIPVKPSTLPTSTTVLHQLIPPSATLTIVQNPSVQSRAVNTAEPFHMKEPNLNLPQGVSVTNSVSMMVLHDGTVSSTNENIPVIAVSDNSEIAQLSSLSLTSDAYSSGSNATNPSMCISSPSVTTYCSTDSNKLKAISADKSRPQPEQPSDSDSIKVKEVKTNEKSAEQLSFKSTISTLDSTKETLTGIGISSTVSVSAAQKATELECNNQATSFSVLNDMNVDNSEKVSSQELLFNVTGSQDLMHKSASDVTERKCLSRLPPNMLTETLSFNREEQNNQPIENQSSKDSLKPGFSSSLTVENKLQMMGVEEVGAILFEENKITSGNNTCIEQQTEGISIQSNIIQGQETYNQDSVKLSASVKDGTDQNFGVKGQTSTDVTVDINFSKSCEPAAVSGPKKALDIHEQIFNLHGFQDVSSKDYPLTRKYILEAKGKEVLASKMEELKSEYQKKQVSKDIIQGSQQTENIMEGNGIVLNEVYVKIDTAEMPKKDNEFISTDLPIACDDVPITAQSSESDHVLWEKAVVPTKVREIGDVLSASVNMQSKDSETEIICEKTENTNTAMIVGDKQIVEQHVNTDPSMMSGRKGRDSICEDSLPSALGPSSPETFPERTDGAYSNLLASLKNENVSNPCNSDSKTMSDSVSASDVTSDKVGISSLVGKDERENSDSFSLETSKKDEVSNGQEVCIINNKHMVEDQKQDVAENVGNSDPPEETVSSETTDNTLCANKETGLEDDNEYLLEKDETNLDNHNMEDVGKLEPGSTNHNSQTAEKMKHIPVNHVVSRDGNIDMTDSVSVPIDHSSKFSASSEDIVWDISKGQAEFNTVAHIAQTKQSEQLGNNHVEAEEMKVNAFVEWQVSESKHTLSGEEKTAEGEIDSTTTYIGELQVLPDKDETITEGTSSDKSTISSFPNVSNSVQTTRDHCQNSLVLNKKIKEVIETNEIKDLHNNANCLSEKSEYDMVQTDESVSMNKEPLSFAEKEKDKTSEQLQEKPLKNHLVCEEEKVYAFGFGSDDEDHGDNKEINHQKITCSSITSEALSNDMRVSDYPEKKNLVQPSVTLLNHEIDQSNLSTQKGLKIEKTPVPAPKMVKDCSVTVQVYPLLQARGLNKAKSTFENRISGNIISNLVATRELNVKKVKKNEEHSEKTTDIVTKSDPNEKINQCLICKRIFRSVEGLKRHVRGLCKLPDNGDDFSTIYTCANCQERMTSKHELDAHRLLCIKQSISSKDTFKHSYTCKLCGKMFNLKAEILKHIAESCPEVVKEERGDIPRIAAEVTKHSASSLNVDEDPEITFKTETCDMSMQVDKSELLVGTEEKTSENSSQSFISQNVKNKVKNRKQNSFEFFSTKRKQTNSIRCCSLGKKFKKTSLEPAKKVVPVDPPSCLKSTVVKTYPLRRSSKCEIGSGMDERTGSVLQGLDNSVHDVDTILSSEENSSECGKNIEASTLPTILESRIGAKSSKSLDSQDQILDDKRVSRASKFLKEEFEVPNFIKTRGSKQTNSRPVLSTTSTNPNPIRCDVCQKNFKRERNFLNHLNCIHESPYTCIRNTRANQNFFVCKFCRQKHPTFQNMSIHIMKHHQKIMESIRDSRKEISSKGSKLSEIMDKKEVTCSTDTRACTRSSHNTRDKESKVDTLSATARAKKNPANHKPLEKLSVATRNTRQKNQHDTKLLNGKIISPKIDSSTSSCGDHVPETRSRTRQSLGEKRRLNVKTSNINAESKRPKMNQSHDEEPKREEIVLNAERKPNIKNINSPDSSFKSKKRNFGKSRKGNKRYNQKNVARSSSEQETLKNATEDLTCDTEDGMLCRGSSSLVETENQMSQSPEANDVSQEKKESLDKNLDAPDEKENVNSESKSEINTVYPHPKEELASSNPLKLPSDMESKQESVQQGTNETAAKSFQDSFVNSVTTENYTECSSPSSLSSFSTWDLKSRGTSKSRSTSPLTHGIISSPVKPQHVAARDTLPIHTVVRPFTPLEFCSSDCEKEAQCTEQDMDKIPSGEDQVEPIALRSCSRKRTSSNLSEDDEITFPHKKSDDQEHGNALDPWQKSFLSYIDSASTNAGPHSDGRSVYSDTDVERLLEDSPTNEVSLDCKSKDILENHEERSRATRASGEVGGYNISGAVMYKKKSRVRHMYHDGKIWQIGKGSVTAVNVSEIVGEKMAAKTGRASKRKFGPVVQVGNEKDGKVQTHPKFSPPSSEKAGPSSLKPNVEKLTSVCLGKPNKKLKSCDSVPKKTKINS